MIKFNVGDKVMYHKGRPDQQGPFTIYEVGRTTVGLTRDSDGMRYSAVLFEHITLIDYKIPKEIEDVINELIENEARMDVLIKLNQVISKFIK